MEIGVVERLQAFHEPLVHKPEGVIAAEKSGRFRGQGGAASQRIVQRLFEVRVAAGADRVMPERIHHVASAGAQPAKDLVGSPAVALLVIAPEDDPGRGIGRAPGPGM